MAWPPSNPAQGLKIEGLSTIVWGTAGVVSNNPSFSSYIVKSLRATQRTEQAVIENSAGLTATQILLDDGINYEVTVVDDSSINPPCAGSVVGIVMPAMSSNFVLTSSNNVPAFVVDTGASYARKSDGERTLTLKTYTLFTPS